MCGIKYIYTFLSPHAMGSVSCENCWTSFLQIQKIRVINVYPHIQPATNDDILKNVVIIIRKFNLSFFSDKFL